MYTAIITEKLAVTTPFMVLEAAPITVSRTTPVPLAIFSKRFCMSVVSNHSAKPEMSML